MWPSVFSRGVLGKGPVEEIEVPGSSSSVSVFNITHKPDL